MSNVLSIDMIEGKREMSTKTLADVIESLIGAAFQDGGFYQGNQVSADFPTTRRVGSGE